uniref:Uncharacterized protein n=1 Tax=Anguilla anguilla TaxID=7936 RepID=A0A0E9UUJ2_ANGAN
MCMARLFNVKQQCRCLTIFVQAYCISSNKCRL